MSESFGRCAWAAWIGPERDGDGQSSTIHVAPTDGAHVTEADAEVVRSLLRNWRDACDRIVNNGMGEPTECGHSLPCEYHNTEAASPAALDAERLYRAIEAVTEEWDDQNDEPTVVFAGSQYDLRERIATEYARLAQQDGTGE